MKSFFSWVALGAILCAVALAEESKQSEDASFFSPLINTRFGHRIRPLPRPVPALHILFPKTRPAVVKAKPIPAEGEKVDGYAQEGTGTTYNWGQHTGTGGFDWGKYTSTAAPNKGQNQTATTYNWGQHTGNTFDWGKYTSTAAPSNNSTGGPNQAQNGTTYDWGQHTGNTFDWGKYTSTAAPNNNATGGPSQGTTYDWGKHTGSTFDWGKYTSTAAPSHNSTGGPSQGTTYDWGKHTGSTFDWGKYTSTQSPNQGHNSTSGPSQGTTYDWGKHTGSTYDWGQHTKPTQAPNQNGTDNGHNNGQNNGTDNNQNQHPCGAGSYSCSGAIGLCLGLKQVCDGVIDCPMADDEEPRVCHPAFAPARPNVANSNRFRGQGFMFAIKNIKIGGGSNVKLFDQQSNNNVRKSG